MNAKIVLFLEWNLVGRWVCLLGGARYFSESHVRSSSSVAIKINKLINLMEQFLIFVAYL